MSLSYRAYRHDFETRVAIGLPMEMWLVSWTFLSVNISNSGLLVKLPTRDFSGRENAKIIDQLTQAESDILFAVEDLSGLSNSGRFQGRGEIIRTFWQDDVLCLAFQVNDLDQPKWMSFLSQQSQISYRLSQQPDYQDILILE
jgi:hypothetical protein